MPEHCRITAVLTPSSDSHIAMEVLLPSQEWNGKFQAVGNGGWAGVISYSAMASALAEGYATASNDTGHVDLLQTNGTPIEAVLSLSNLTNTGSAWLLFTHNFATIPVGQTVRLRITSTNNQTLGTNFFFDTLSLKATHCP